MTVMPGTKWRKPLKMLELQCSQITTRPVGCQALTLPPIGDCYLLGVLNSASAFEYLKKSVPGTCLALHSARSPDSGAEGGGRRVDENRSARQVNRTYEP